MSSQHTPGPWICDEGGLVTGQESRPRFQPSPSVDIFDASEWPLELRKEALANAWLITAAPDLLAALKFVLLTSDKDTEKEIYCCCPSKRERGPHATDCEQARAAIARAEGGAE